MGLTSGNYGGFRKTITECCRNGKHILTSNQKVNNKLNIIFSEKNKIITYKYKDNLELIKNNNNIYYMVLIIFKKTKKIINQRFNTLKYKEIIELVSNGYFFRYYNHSENNKTFEIIPLTIDDMGSYPFFLLFELL